MAAIAMRLMTFAAAFSLRPPRLRVLVVLRRALRDHVPPSKRSGDWGVSSMQDDTGDDAESRRDELRS